MIYVALFTLLAILTLLDLVDDDRFLIKKGVFVGLVLLLVFISAIRWETGPDWDSYHNFYENIHAFVGGMNFFEPGYTVVNLVFSTLDVPYTFFLAFLALITIGLKAVVFFRYFQIAFLLFFLFFCYYLADIFSVRQFTAVALCLYGLRFVEEKRLLRFSIAIVIATSIHVSSCLFFVAYWLYWVKASDRLLYTVLFLGCLVGLFDVASLLINMVVGIAGTDAIIAEKILRYGEEGIGTSHANPYFSYFLGLLKRSFILPLLIYGRRFLSSEDAIWYSGQLNLLVFGNVIYFVFIISVPVITRLALPFLYMEIFLLASLVYSCRDIKTRLLLILSLIAFGAIRLYLFMEPYWELYVPFQSIFESYHIINRY